MNVLASSLFAGVVGDSLGYQVEFDSLDQIVQKYGPKGITLEDISTGEYYISDDSQMTFFTLEGIIRYLVRYDTRGMADLRSMLVFAYRRWLSTQNDLDESVEPSWLSQHSDMCQVRAPGHTCLSALKAASPSMEIATNNSKGCGGVIRIAPIALVAASADSAFKEACRASSITHGHDTGIVAAGAFAFILWNVSHQWSLENAIGELFLYMENSEFCLSYDCSETIHSLKNALNLAHLQPPVHFIATDQLGEGWVAEEAFAISVFCCLVASDFEECIRLSVNHSGDSDSTGSMAGQLWGAIHAQDVETYGVLMRHIREGKILGELLEDFERTKSNDLENKQFLREKYPGC